MKRIFGYPGDGINDLMGALDRTHCRIELVQVRHEEQADTCRNIARPIARRAVILAFASIP